MNVYTVMFAGTLIVSVESLVQDEMPRHTSHKIYIIQKCLTIFHCIIGLP